MSKSNKELAVEIVLKAIEVRTAVPYGANNTHVTPALSSDSICKMLEQVHQTLCKLNDE